MQLYTKLNQILRFLFPEKCIECSMVLNDRELRLICTSCFESIQPIQSLDFLICRICGGIISGRNSGSICQDCFPGKYAFRRNRSVFLYRNHLVRELFHRFKFESSALAGEDLAQMLSNPIKEILKETQNETMIVPVPVSDSVRKKRGFNQVEFILKKTGISYYNILYRKEHARKQSELTAEERRLAVREQFGIRHDAVSQIAGQHLILVDDVFTTGSTVSEVSRILMENGAKAVESVTFFKD